MKSVRFDSPECLSAYFGRNGASVGPRKGTNRRTQEQKELFNVRQYLLALAANDRLGFPLILVIGDKPDFVLSNGLSEEWGLEVTEATTNKWQRELTISEGKEPSVQLLGRDGWAGNSAERETCAAILRAMRRKAKKIRNGHYKPISRYDVLIYVNVRAFFYSDEEVFRLLLPRIARWRSQWSGLGRVEIIAALHLFHDVTQKPILLPLSSSRRRKTNTDEESGVASRSNETVRTLLVSE